MHKYLPTPKVVSAIILGAVGFLFVLAANYTGFAEIQSAASALVVLALSAIGGYLKHDTSSPEPKIPDHHDDDA